MKGGVYIIVHPLYNNSTSLTKIVKIGCSHDISNRFYSADTFLLSKHSLLKNIECILHSPSNCYSGVRLLESFVHIYYKQKRIEENREFFKMDSSFRMENDSGLKKFLELKNITDIKFYNQLEDVPTTQLDPEFLTNQVQYNYNPTITFNITSSNIFNPRPFQSFVVQQMINYYIIDRKDKGCIFLPPGIGKTYIAGCFLQQLPNAIHRVLILTPQIMIADEFSMMFKNVQQDRRVVILSSEDLDITQIYEELKSIPRLVVVCTYQTFNLHSYLMWEYDMIMYDEAHHLVTSNIFQSALEIKGKKLFLTATPKIIHIDNKTNEYADYSLDNDELYGKAIYTLSLHDGIRKGMLCDYRLLIYEENEVKSEQSPIISSMAENEFEIVRDDVRQINMEVEEENNLNKIDEEYEDEKEYEDDKEDVRKEEKENNSDEEVPHLYQPKTVTDCTPHIKCLVEVYKRKHIVVFYNQCESAKKACESLTYLGAKGLYVDGIMPKSQRKLIFEDFQTYKNGLSKILFNVNIVSEGVSLPCADCILLMESRSSQIVLTQIIGRALRTHPGKNEAIICVPQRCAETIEVAVKSLYVDAEMSSKQLEGKIVSINNHLLTECKAQTREIICDIITKQVTMLDITRRGGVWMCHFWECVEWEKNNPTSFITEKSILKKNKIGTWINTQKKGYNK